MEFKGNLELVSYFIKAIHPTQSNYLTYLCYVGGLAMCQTFLIKSMTTNCEDLPSIQKLNSLLDRHQLVFLCVFTMIFENVDYIILNDSV